jgi:predicted DNA-binding transcriptional regulator AlpA
MRNTIQQTPEAVTGEPQMTATRYGSKKDVARMVQMSTRSVDNFINEGCPHLKLGARRVRFDMVETRQWLAETFRVQRRGQAKGGAL